MVVVTISSELVKKGKALKLSVSKELTKIVAIDHRGYHRNHN